MTDFSDWLTLAIVFALATIALHAVTLSGGPPK